ncbi:MAG: hypothetical protein U9R41_04300, partial [Candidatus Marinimicrobia bacterium]|nr:hypothetical protein [Candidatus Neomarinimicrobiota bacterium]
MNNKFNRNFMKLPLILLFLYLTGCEELFDPTTVELTAPSNFTYKKIKINSIQFSWTDNSVGEEGFKIDKKIVDGNWIAGYGVVDADTTQWIDENAEINKKLQYRICAYFDNDSSSFIETDVIDNIFPSPTNISYESIAIDEVQLNWTDNSNGEDGFKIDKKVDEGNWNLSYGVVDSNITQWTDENAEINSNFQYRVYAYVGIDSSSSIETEFIDNTFPVPSNLVLEQIDLGTPTCKLTWEDNSIGEEGFKIDRRIDDGKWVDSLGIVDSNITEWTDNSITSDYDIIYYRVYAYSGEYTSVKIEKNSNTIFPGPTNLVSGSIAIDKIKLIWTDNSNSEEGFKIDKRLEDGNWIAGYGIVGENVKQWTDESAEINSKLQYRVYAYNSENVSSSVETDVIDNIFPSPTNISYESIAIDEVQLNWTDNSNGEDGFKI